MAKKSTSKKSTKKAPWNKPNPAKKSKKLSPAKKSKAKAAAKRAGRTYPNLVDNMGMAAKKKKTSKRSSRKSK